MNDPCRSEVHLRIRLRQSAMCILYLVLLRCVSWFQGKYLKAPWNHTIPETRNFVKFGIPGRLVGLKRIGSFPEIDNLSTLAKPTSEKTLNSLVASTPDCRSTSRSRRRLHWEGGTNGSPTGREKLDICRVGGLQNAKTIRSI